MIDLTLGEVATIVDGRLVGADPATPVTGSLEFDSRLVTPGGLFLALPGERVDGHDYVGAVTAAGAAASLVTRPVDGPTIQVADGFEALAALAGAVVRRLPDATVIGVTGSSGKTSTKDVLAQLLARLGPTVAPPGSFNNELGHPYTVLRADTSTRFLVLETSARGIGHIRYLTGIAPPRIGAVLNVGLAHVGEFGSQQAIAQAKGELVEALPPDGLAVLNADDPLVLAMRTRTAARVVTVGLAADADLRAEDVSLDELGRPRFDLVSGDRRGRVALRLVGAHHVGNVLAAAAVALECGLAFDDLAAALGEVTAGSRWRMELTERADGVLVINDAYNANPESMRAAVQTLAEVGRHRAGRTFAVLGEMAELGADAADEHEKLGRLVAQLPIAQLVAVGDAARSLERGAALEGSSRRHDGQAARTSWVPDVDAAVSLLRRELRTGDAVLVKASRAARLERVAQAIENDTVSDPAAGPADEGGGTG